MCMEKNSTMRSLIPVTNRAKKLAEELEQLKKELKHTRVPFQRACIADEMRSVAAELAKYTTR